MAVLQKLADNLWIAFHDHRWLGLHVGTRMTVVRLTNGSLWLHSPVHISARLREELDGLGQVTHIVCPNLYHHVYAGEAVEAYPRAMLHGPHALRQKRKDLSFAADLSDTPHPDWADDLKQVTIEGCLLAETVFFHPASRTLISSDLVENFRTSPHWPTRLFLNICGIRGQITWNPLLRFVYRDRKVARACIDRVLTWPFERVVIAHGDIIVDHAHEGVERGLSWL